MDKDEAIKYLEDMLSMIGTTATEYWTEKEAEKMKDAIFALQVQDSKTRRICDTCKHDPPSKKWPCVDCDMKEPADRWKEIDYTDCANAMMKMWIDNVLTDGEYSRIMDKLNTHWAERRKDEYD